MAPEPLPMPPTPAQCRTARAIAAAFFKAIPTVDASVFNTRALNLHDFFRACEAHSAYVYAKPEMCEKD